MFEKELDLAKHIFDTHNSDTAREGTPPVNKNMPRVSGALKWSQELRERISKPMSALKMSVNHG